MNTNLHLINKRTGKIHADFKQKPRLMALDEADGHWVFATAESIWKVSDE